MATRTSKKLGKVQAWGIASTNGDLALVATRNGRMAIRALKREVFPGNEYKVVRADATLTAYNK